MFSPFLCVVCAFCCLLWKGKNHSGRPKNSYNSDDEDYNQISVLQIREVVSFNVNILKGEKCRTVQLVFNFDQLTPTNIKNFFCLFFGPARSGFSLLYIVVLLLRLNAETLALSPTSQATNPHFQTRKRHLYFALIVLCNRYIGDIHITFAYITRCVVV